MLSLSTGTGRRAEEEGVTNISWHRQGEMLNEEEEGILFPYCLFTAVGGPNGHYYERYSSCR